MFSYSQGFICGDDQQEILNKIMQSKSILQPVADDPSIVHVFNVMYHVVYNDDGVTRTNSLGQPGLNIGEYEVLQSIQNLNIAFNQFNIYFKYYGMDQINETDYLIIEDYAEREQLFNSGFSNPDAINIFVINGSVMGADARVRIFNDDLFVDPWTQCHEMGHYFGLAHPDVSYPGFCEHATRDSSNINFNADVAGDWVVDTHVYTNIAFYDGNCSYMGGAVDCEGTAIVAEPMANGVMVYPTFQNFMYVTYSPTFSGLTCNLNPQFTAGQGALMRENILGYYAAEYNAARNTLESLYAPFTITDGGSNGGGPIYSKTYTPNFEFTGVNVWNCGPFTMRFQPGFQQIFSNLPNTQTVSATTQFNHPTFSYIGVKIPSLSDTVIINHPAPVCFMSYEPFISGDVKSTYNLGSGVYTQEQLNEIKASDPKLFEELQSQKYHIITKQTESGFNDQKIIFKN